MKFSFNFMEENKPANSENKTYMRPSHFYKVLSVLFSLNLKFSLETGRLRSK